MSASTNDKKNEAISVVALALKHIPSGQFLLARRSEAGSGAGEWEFPGGKVEFGESPQMALVREIAEELSFAIRPESLTYLGQNTHEYPQKKIQIQLWLSEVLIKPEFKLVDHDMVTWLRPENMQEINLSAGDKYFISLLNSI